MTVLERMCLRDAIMSAPDPEAAITSVTASSPHVVSMVAQVEREFAIYQRREGVFSVRRCLPPRILAQPCAASAAERNWSIYGQVRSEQRSRMKHAVADKLVYAHEALHLEQKMQSAGWAADIERWESDTDSDGSDEEVDFKEGSNLSGTQVLALCM
jgi:hypothetical protein